ncbi:unnamed protein product [Effrenium voratum]|nr:unnamed protein product [Effrenium voratum]
MTHLNGRHGPVPRKARTPSCEAPDGKVPEFCAMGFHKPLALRNLGALPLQPTAASCVRRTGEGAARHRTGVMAACRCLMATLSVVDCKDGDESGFICIDPEADLQGFWRKWDGMP